jgi:hypothetical protein
MDLLHGKLSKEARDRIHSLISPEDQKVLQADQKRWKTLSSGSHLADWMAFAPGLKIRRTVAMQIAETNRPKGQAYNMAMSALLRMDGIDDQTLKKMLSHVLWLADDEDRMEILRDIQQNMSPGERARLNSPLTARRKVEAGKA